MANAIETASVFILFETNDESYFGLGSLLATVTVDWAFLHGQDAKLRPEAYCIRICPVGSNYPEPIVFDGQGPEVFDRQCPEFFFSIDGEEANPDQINFCATKEITFYIPTLCIELREKLPFGLYNVIGELKIDITKYLGDRTLFPLFDTEVWDHDINDDDDNNDADNNNDAGDNNNDAGNNNNNDAGNNNNDAGNNNNNAADNNNNDAGDNNNDAGDNHHKKDDHEQPRQQALSSSRSTTSTMSSFCKVCPKDDLDAYKYNKKMREARIRGLTLRAVEATSSPQHLARVASIKRWYSSETVAQLMAFPTTAFSGQECIASRMPQLKTMGSMFARYPHLRKQNDKSSALVKFDHPPALVGKKSVRKTKMIGDEDYEKLKLSPERKKDVADLKKDLDYLDLSNHHSYHVDVKVGCIEHGTLSSLFSRPETSANPRHTLDLMFQSPAIFNTSCPMAQKISLRTSVEDVRKVKVTNIPDILNDKAMMVLQKGQDSLNTLGSRTSALMSASDLSSQLETVTIIDHERC